MNPKKYHFLIKISFLTIILLIIFGIFGYFAKAKAASSIWLPSLKTSWQIQFTGKINTAINAEMLDLDLFDTPTATIFALHKNGKKIICYLNAGSYEDWRPDKNKFPQSILGKNYAGWPGEKWLDIRQINKLAPIMRARLDMCKQKGFDGVDPDNINGYANKTGFNLTYEDQLKYNIWLANEAHKRGLSIGLKNDIEQKKDLIQYYDWATIESCFSQGWCDDAKDFVKAGKPVFQIEYYEAKINFKKACEYASQANYNLILKKNNLNAWNKLCP
jgi:hypothetical protein